MRTQIIKKEFIRLLKQYRNSSKPSENQVLTNENLQSRITMHESMRSSLGIKMCRNMLGNSDLTSSSKLFVFSLARPSQTSQKK
jgi:hypothetical protein